MKIDWKTVCKSPGYITLKQTYIREVEVAGRSQHGWRTKNESYRHFQWVIGRATSYAYHKNTTLDAILYEWESKRNYCWHNFYQDYNQRKIKPGL